MDSEKTQQGDFAQTIHDESLSEESISVNEPHHLKRNLKARHIQVRNMKGVGVILYTGRKQ
jgi:amino acid permease